MYRYLWLWFVLIFPGASAAQHFTGGVKVGLVASEVAGDTYVGYHKAGIQAGGWVSRKLSGRHGFQLELTFIQKGSRENPKPLEGKYASYLLRLNYVQMPLLYRFHLTDRFSLETGPAANVLVHSFELVDEWERTDRPFSPVNLSLIIGVGYRWTDRLRVTFRTDNSLFSIRSRNYSGDVWRFWGHGQFIDALTLNLQVKI